MPTIHRYRVWCKSCENFTLHSRKDTKDPNENEFTCISCGTIYSSIKLKDIPTDKLQEQRARWKKSEGNFLGKYLDVIGKSPEQRQMEELVHMFSPPGSDIEIHESDAGQKIIDEENRKIREAEWEEKRKIREAQAEEAAKYAKLGRNDICICGSGLKYKKCCLTRIQSYK